MPSQAQFFKLWMADGRIGARHARRIEPRGSGREDARSAPAAGILFIRPAVKLDRSPGRRADQQSTRPASRSLIR